MIWSVTIIVLFIIPLFPVELFKISPVLLCSGLSVVFMLNPRARENCRNINKAIILPLFIFMIIAGFTALWSKHTVSSLHDASYFVSYIILFIFFSCLEKNKRYQAAMAVIISSVAVSIIAIAQRFFYFDRALFSVIGRFNIFTESEFSYMMYILTKYRVCSMFNNPNLLASYLLMVNLISFGFILDNAAKKRVKILYFLCAVCMVNTLVLWFTRSVSGIMSFILGAGVFFVAVKACVPNKIRTYKWYVLFLFIVCLYFLSQLFITRYSANDYGYSLFAALENRIEFWKAAWAFILNKPFGFLGLGNFSQVYQVHVEPALVVSSMAHNIILQLWIETSVYGLIAFVWFIAIMLYSAVRGISRAGDFVYIGLFSAVVAFLLHNITDFGFFVPQVSAIWWILAGLLIGSIKNNG